ncbi:MAG TPA: DUF5662 family protein [Candidatus Dojkabacteria bacterium]|nr:DUF5662 family protein [Candidatus Dojkabacteria bacterium]
MLSINYLFENARADGKTTQAMVEHFTNRTNYHIKLVQNYLDEIIALNDPRLDNKILEKEKINHDQSKFKDPEYIPYLHVNWSYNLKNQGKKYNPPEAIKDQMQAATFHHVKNNQHHPEFWDDKATIGSINGKDRDKPSEQMVDATSMPLTYIAVMVADWLAVSNERKTDPYQWAEININKRWKFSTDQVKLIYDLLDTIWGKKFNVSYR